MGKVNENTRNLLILGVGLAGAVAYYFVTRYSKPADDYAASIGWGIGNAAPSDASSGPAGQSVYNVQFPASPEVSIKSMFPEMPKPESLASVMAQSGAVNPSTPAGPSAPEFFASVNNPTQPAGGLSGGTPSQPVASPGGATGVSGYQAPGVSPSGTQAGGYSTKVGNATVQAAPASAYSGGLQPLPPAWHAPMVLPAPPKPMEAPKASVTTKPTVTYAASQNLNPVASVLSWFGVRF